MIKLNIKTLKIYIIILCITDYIFTIIGIKLGYIVELNFIFCNIFKNNQYILGFVYKIVLTLICIQIIYLLNKKILPYILCLYLSVNFLHIFYFILGITL